VDNNQRAKLVTRQDARDAIDAILANRPSLNHTPASLLHKWAYKEEAAIRKPSAWRRAVSLTDVDAED